MTKSWRRWLLYKKNHHLQTGSKNSSKKKKNYCNVRVNSGSSQHPTPNRSSPCTTFVPVTPTLTRCENPLDAEHLLGRIYTMRKRQMDATILETRRTGRIANWFCKRPCSSHSQYSPSSLCCLVWVLTFEKKMFLTSGV